MRKLEEILEYNKSFVENKEYEQYVTSKHPNKKIVVLSCMDTRLTELLPKAMNLKNGDVKLIKKCRSYYNASFWKYYEKCFSCNLRI
nr:hypothetical protein [Clostridioides difficile]